MGGSIPQSVGCRVIRVTSEHDMTTERGLLWLLGVVREIPKHIPILLWGSIPCTGGSAWIRLNLKQYPNSFPGRLRMLRKQWRKMFLNFTRVCDVIRRRGGYWALEWPSTCAYWDSPIVEEFFKKAGNPTYQATATGCAFGLKATYGSVAGFPMSKA